MCAAPMAGSRAAPGPRKATARVRVSRTSTATAEDSGANKKAPVQSTWASASPIG